MNGIHKVPPQSIEAEVSVLGAMLLDKNAIIKAVEILKEDFFYKTAHGKIYNSIVDLFDKGEPVDLVTLTNSLKKNGDLEKIGGVSYLATILNAVPTSAHIENYLQIIQEKALLRKLISASTEIIDNAYTEAGEVTQMLDRAEQLIFNVVSRKTSYDFVLVADMLHDSFEAIEKLYADRHNITGVPSGFVDFDKVTCGFQPSDLIIIAGRPSMGKSSFCLNIALHAGTRAKTPIGIFSLEMSKEQVVQRLLCTEARVNSTSLRSGFLGESDWPKLTTSAGILAESKIYIDDTPNISVLELRAKARRLKAKYDVGLIIIDYLQLMQGKKGTENRQQEISEISRSLKALAREISIPVIALSQLSRAVEGRSDRRPQLFDLRESGAIEQDADLVVFIYRPEYYQPLPENKGIAEIIIGKHRHGPIENFKLAFVKEYTRFENLSSESSSY
ncbi:replicative DNA helicase [bacterium]|nr:replicative DNA helicase [bacterium]MBU1153203.1 replicative DNA helicase [bacterium]